MTQERDSSEKAPDSPKSAAPASEAEASERAQVSVSDGAAAVVAPDVEPAAAEGADEGATGSATGEPSVKPKKGKKGRRKVKSTDAGSVSVPRSELDADGRERPAFVLDFPYDPELEPLIAAFEAGNYARVREVAPRLIERSERPEVKAAAQELLERIEPDPLIKFLLAVAVALFVAVVVFVYQSHG